MIVGYSEVSLCTIGDSDTFLFISVQDYVADELKKPAIALSTIKRTLLDRREIPIMSTKVIANVEK